MRLIDKQFADELGDRVGVVIDAIDGPLARRLDVVRLQPNWSGDILDLVVDFLTYVFIPAYAITASKTKPASTSALSAAPLVEKTSVTRRMGPSSPAAPAARR